LRAGRDLSCGTISPELVLAGQVLTDQISLGLPLSRHALKSFQCLRHLAARNLSRSIGLPHPQV
jgi:hypothetical protein